MKQSCEVAIVGSGFAGSLLARVVAVLGYDVVLLERGTHPRFAIGESSTPLANLSLERIGSRMIHFRTRTGCAPMSIIILFAKQSKRA